MNIILILSIFCLFRVSADDRIWNPFFIPADDPSNTVHDFFDDQATKMRAFFDGAMKVKDSVDNYVDSVKESSRKVVETWSYLPAEEPGARLDNPDVVLSVPAIIARNGYPCETHTVISEGYLLNVHRIPHSKMGGKTPSRTILLQHGLFASSADWILNGPEKGLAYALADAGYDVWMANIRGNKYAREHAWLKTDSKSYWNFSWHDIALNDVPAVIDYILKLKGSSTRISYIGHSMGTTILFAMLVLRPEYNDILDAGVALAPEVFMTDVKSPLKSLAPAAINMAYMEMLYGSHEFTPKNSMLGKLSSSCEASSPDSLVCKNFMFYICGANEKQFDKNMLPVFLSHLGTGTSWKTAVHFAQELLAGGKFQKFDYGPYNNQKLYGSETPPEYDLSKITLPITLFWAQNDLLSSEKDVMMLYDRLPRDTTGIYLVEDPAFNHLDYLMARDARRLVNEKVLESLRKTADVDDYYSLSYRFLKKY